MKILAYVLGAMWLAWGVMHFTAHDEVVRQMPSYFPWKSFFVVITGIAELAIGAGLFVARTRRIAALAAVVLLVLYTPAVIHMVWNDILPTTWPQWARTFARWFIPPHNVVFAYLAYRVAKRS